MRNAERLLDENGNEADWFCCSAVVFIQPAFWDAAKAAIAQLPDVEIYGGAPDTGRLVVVVSHHRQKQLMVRLDEIKEIEGVTSVSLIYSQRDDQN